MAFIVIKGDFMKKAVLVFTALNLVGCVAAGQVGMEYVRATAIRTAYEMKASEYHTSMLTDKKTKDSSECIGEAFRHYNDDGNYIYSDVKVVQIKGENYTVISKSPYNPKAVVAGNFLTPPMDYNVDQILFLTEINESTSGKNRIDIWANPDLWSTWEKIELAKTIISPCI
jgi:hypothetical protein